MKRLLYLLCFIFFITTPCMAENIVVESLSEYSKEEIESDFEARVLEEANFNNGLKFEENSVIKGKILKAVDAKIGKRNAYIVIQPLICEKADGNIENIEEENFEAKVVGYSKKDFKNTALKAGLAVGGHFVKGIGQIFYFSKGLILPDEDKSRLKSAAHNVYENSPFVYIEKGQEINIEKGDKLVLKMYRSDVPKWRVLKRQK